jgi:hypothetical protein
VQKELEVRRQLVDYESPVGMGPVPFPVPSNNFRREYHSCDRGDTVAKSVSPFGTIPLLFLGVDSLEFISTVGYAL